MKRKYVIFAIVITIILLLIFQFILIIDYSKKNHKKIRKDIITYQGYNYTMPENWKKQIVNENNIEKLKISNTISKNNEIINVTATIFTIDISSINKNNSLDFLNNSSDLEKIYVDNNITEIGNPKVIAHNEKPVVVYPCMLDNKKMIRIYMPTNQEFLYIIYYTYSKTIDNKEEYYWETTDIDTVLDFLQTATKE